MMTKQRPERHGGFSLIELLLVILVLGIMTTIAVLAVSGLTGEAESVGCDADAHGLHVAAEAFFAQDALEQIPAAGVGADRFEQTLVDREFLRQVSALYNVDADGALTAVVGSACAV